MKRILYYGMFLLIFSFTSSNGQIFDNEGKLNGDVQAVVYGEYNLNKKSEKIFVLKKLGIDDRDIKLLASKKESIVRKDYPQLYTRYISIILADKNKSKYRFMTIWVRNDRVTIDGEKIAFFDFLEKMKVLDEYNKQVKK